MEVKPESQSSIANTLKLILSSIFVIAGLAGFYMFEEKSVLLGVILLLAAIAVAVGIALYTDQGRRVWGFIKEAQIEVKKVVWPTRDETVKTTLAVVAVVVVVAVFLWLLDMFLGWSLQAFTGG
jgi:preprotein translocase subunit SecE